MRPSFLKLTLATLALGAYTTGFGQAPVIIAFSQNGELVCTNLAVGSTATVEWAPAVTGPWTNNWAGQEAVRVDGNGVIRVSVPMFYRVRGIAAPPQMALIPAGVFEMGDSLDGVGYERPVHTVYVSAFYMDMTEVTTALWDEVCSWATNRALEVRYSFDNGALGKAPSHPIYDVTWYDAVKWCNARSEKEGLLPAYYTTAEQTNVYRAGTNSLEASNVNWTAGYRLPTEAEWEKAARGGVSGRRFPWADADTISHSRANYLSRTNELYDVSPTRGQHPAFIDDVQPYTSPVGYFAANGYGLYDMAGNVWEWCWDWSGVYSSGMQGDPRGPLSGSKRIIRGNSMNGPGNQCATAFRTGNMPDGSHIGYGFRCVLPPTQ